jgi:hypothetical protein
MKTLITAEEQYQLSKVLSEIFNTKLVDMEYEPYFIEFDNQTHPAQNPFFGQQHNNETKKHLSIKQSTKTGTNNQFYGKKHKKETIESNRQKNIEIQTIKFGKKVIQCDLSGKEIATHDSVRSAARAIGVKYYNQISKSCRGLISNSYGYIWKYSD